MAGVENREITSDENAMRLDRWFRLHYPDLAFGRLQKLLRKGDVRLDGKRVKNNTRLAAGQNIRIPPLGDFGKPEEGRRKIKKKKESNPCDAVFVQNLVVYKNQNILALNKPHGLAVQGGTKTERHLDGMLDHLRFDAEERPRLVHRLDRDTSGIMLLARNRQAATDLGRAFRMHSTRKLYWAVVVGVPDVDAGTIDLPLSRAGGKGRERIVGDEEAGKNAITEFEILERAGMKFALVALWPKTGRTHQLRAHMAAIGCPILGDGKYGGAAARKGGVGAAVSRKLHLHAREIDLPDGRRLKAALPSHMKTTFELWGFDEQLADHHQSFEKLV